MSFTIPALSVHYLHSAVPRARQARLAGLGRAGAGAWACVQARSQHNLANGSQSPYTCMGASATLHFLLAFFFFFPLLAGVEKPLSEAVGLLGGAASRRGLADMIAASGGV